MKIDQVAIQLYTLREFTKTPQDIAATMKKVREIGYRAVQASAMGPIAEEELLRILDGEGLVLCATHEPSDTILDEPEKVADRLRKLKCKYTAYPSPKGIDLASEPAVADWIGRLNRAGKVLHEAGQVLTYHNHHHEFRRLGGKTILERIFAETDPRYLQGELDTYWVQHGGGDPVAWCAKLPGRLPLLHIKDYIVTNESKVTFAEIGNGNLDFRAIVAAAEKSGCEWFIVEQDTCPGDPFVSIRQSFDYIQANLV
jgi:sugar phosphate isomerase/epimerase